MGGMGISTYICDFCQGGKRRQRRLPSNRLSYGELVPTYNSYLPHLRRGRIVTPNRKQVQMGDFLGAHASEILSFLIGLAGGGTAGSFITLRFTRQNRVTRGGSIIDQSRASAGGDIVGRDKIAPR